MDVLSVWIKPPLSDRVSSGGWKLQSKPPLNTSMQKALLTFHFPHLFPSPQGGWRWELCHLPWFAGQTWVLTCALQNALLRDVCLFLSRVIFHTWVGWVGKRFHRQQEWCLRGGKKSTRSVLFYFVRKFSQSCCRLLPGRGPDQIGQITFSWSHPGSRSQRAFALEGFCNFLWRK